MSGPFSPTQGPTSNSLQIATDQARNTLLGQIQITLELISTALTALTAVGSGGPYTVATLPAAAPANRGARTFITDGLAAATVGSAVVGGGVIYMPVYSTGAAWLNG